MLLLTTHTEGTSKQSNSKANGYNQASIKCRTKHRKHKSDKILQGKDIWPAWFMLSSFMSNRWVFTELWYHGTIKESEWASLSKCELLHLVPFDSGQTPPMISYFHLSCYKTKYKRSVSFSFLWDCMTTGFSSQKCQSVLTEPLALETCSQNLH